jgi:hypothetical protein
MLQAISRTDLVVKAKVSATAKLGLGGAAVGGAGVRAIVEQRAPHQGRRM